MRLTEQLTSEEWDDNAIKDSSNALMCLADTACDLKLEFDKPSLEQRQAAIALYHRAMRLAKMTRNLRNDLRRYRKQYPSPS